MVVSQTLPKSEKRSLLRGIRWETYQALAWDLAENSSKKLTYNQGILEIMTPLPEHELNKRFLGRMVEMGENALLREFREWLQSQWN